MKAWRLVKSKEMLWSFVTVLYASSGQTVNAQYAQSSTKNPAIVPVPVNAEWWTERMESTNSRVSKGDADIVFLGDSITQGWEDSGRQVWEKCYGHRKAVNLGFSGDETQHLLWRLDNGNIEGISPKVAVVLIGTNNCNTFNMSAESITAGITAVVDKLRNKLPETRILLLAVFPRGEKPNPLREKLTDASRMVSGLADGKMVHYLDIGDRFLDKNNSISRKIMPDYLHLSEKGYEIWAESMEPLLARLLEESTGKQELTDAGRTLMCPMENAPFPHASRKNGFKRGNLEFPYQEHYSDSTVGIFIPDGYQDNGQVNILLYLHGHYNNVANALDEFKLREQLVRSGKNLILVFPEGPRNAGDSGCGKLEEKDGLKKLVEEVLTCLRKKGLVKSDHLGTVLLVGHSGAYRGLSFCAEHGGLEKNIGGICLLDATYDRLKAFADWIGNSPDGRFFSIYTEHLSGENEELMAMLTQKKIDFARLTDAEKEMPVDKWDRITFMRTTRLNHNQTVQWLEPWLRSVKLTNP